MREAAGEMEAGVVEVRKEDKTIKPFSIPFQKDHGSSTIMTIESVTLPGRNKPMQLINPLTFKRGMRVHLCGPNGVGKTTFLENIVNGRDVGARVNKDSVIGYYRQDFNNLDMESTVLKCLDDASKGQHQNSGIEMKKKHC